MQDKKISAQLLELALQKALNDGYYRIVIWAISKNKRAVDFYKKHSYIIEKTKFLN